MFDSTRVLDIVNAHYRTLQDLQRVHRELDRRFASLEDATLGLILSAASGDPHAVDGEVRRLCGPGLADIQESGRDGDKHRDDRKDQDEKDCPHHCYPNYLQPKAIANAAMPREVASVH